jgi:hypothetical protein
VNWPAFTKNLLLIDQRVSAHEAALLKNAVDAVGQLDREGITFLAQLKREAVHVDPLYDQILFRVLRKVVLIDGVISDGEALWLRKMLFSDRQVTVPELEFLRTLRRDAKQVGPEFERLLHDCSDPSGQFTR